MCNLRIKRFSTLELSQMGPGALCTVSLYPAVHSSSMFLLIIRLTKSPAVLSLGSIYSNHFFVNVAKNIGQNAIPVNENHPSILKIKDNLTEPSSFEFKPIKEEFISKQINKLNLKKATGCDGISTKILKLAQTTVVKPITNMINLTIKKSQFPDDAKKGSSCPIT